MPSSTRVAQIVVLTAATVLMMGFGGCPGPTGPTLNPLTLLPTDPCALSSCMPAPALAGTGLSDVCTVTPTMFNSWFKPSPPATTGTATLNGVVLPANSINFPNTPNCSFYQWAMQDFLWLTSPAPPEYGGGGGLIVDSPTFYDVSPPDGSGNRTLLRHSAGLIRPLGLRAAQVGPQGLQLSFDTSGRPFQVRPAEAGATPMVRNAAGQTVQVVHVRLEKGKPILLDAKGKVIQAERSVGAIKPQDRAQIKEAQIPALITATRFIIDGFPIFIDPALAVIDVEQGQATFGGNGGVLEAQLSGVPSSQGERLVYFATIVNDVYAYYATGVLDGKISLTPLNGPLSQGLPVCPGAAPSVTINCFPTNQGDLTQITNFALTAPAPFPTTFPDGAALAVEVKSAWVEAAGLPNLSSYITMTATIPNYTQTSTTTWTQQSGQKTVQLALVGMHVVGSAAGHPEMIWATFEHVANTPRAPYQYINASGTTVTVSPTVSNLPAIGGTSLPWLFSAAGAASPSPGAGALGCNNPPAPPSPPTFNNENMSYDATSTPEPTIVANPPSTISPSSTIRWKAFGGPCDVVPNPVDPSTAASNTEIISIDNDISSMLLSGDVRGNYVLSGATWTVSGMAPINFASAASCANINTVPNGCAVGTSALSNTTMETYQQGVDNTIGSGGTNCLSCHSSPSSSATTAVSHVFINQATGKIGLNKLF